MKIVNSKFGTVKGGVEGLVGRGLFGGGLRAHSVRRESCDCSQQSRACGCVFGGWG